MTRKDYDVDLLIDTLNRFHDRYPLLKIILEPGSALDGRQDVLWLK